MSLSTFSVHINTSAVARRATLSSLETRAWPKCYEIDFMTTSVSRANMCFLSNIDPTRKGRTNIDVLPSK